MNLDVLNGSGRPFWVFVLTTLGVFAFSSFIWGFSYQLSKYHSLGEPVWDHERHAGCHRDRLRRDEDVFWHVRLRQFARLMAHGHVLWAWRSGIIFSLLTSGRKGFVASCLQDHKGEGIRISSIGQWELAQPYLKKHIYTSRPSAVEHNPCTYLITHLANNFFCKDGFNCSKMDYIRSFTLNDGDA